jgi:hypothetical protein
MKDTRVRSRLGLLPSAGNHIRYRLPHSHRKSTKFEIYQVDTGFDSNFKIALKRR